ncbi:Adenylate kinase 2 [Rhodosporidiobolus nylandii]
MASLLTRLAPGAIALSPPRALCRPIWRGLATEATSAAAGADKKLRMIILGAPGAGKGTLSEWLLEKYEIENVVVGQLLRNQIVEGTKLGREAERVMKSGGLLSDETVIKLVEPELERLKGKNWLLDGFPRKASQAVILDEVLAKQGDELNFVASLKVPDRVIIERIEDRYIHLASGRTYNLKFNPPQQPGKDDVTGEPLSQRPDDDPAIVRRRLEVFHAENDPLLAHYDGALVAFEGETSKAIWPKLEAEVERRFPGLQRRAAPP